MASLSDYVITVEESVAKVDQTNTFQEVQNFEKSVRITEFSTGFVMAGTNGINANGAFRIIINNDDRGLIQYYDGGFKSQIVFNADGGVEVRYGGDASKGLITTSTGGDLRGTWTGTVTSDERIKENIVARSGLDNILMLNGVDWDYIEGEEIEGADRSGFTAQNWQEVYPDQVTENEDGKLQILRSIGCQVFDADVVEAIKSLYDKIDDLEEQVSQLRLDAGL